MGRTWIALHVLVLRAVPLWAGMQMPAFLFQYGSGGSREFAAAGACALQPEKPLSSKRPAATVWLRSAVLSAFVRK